jgi:surface protein
MNSFVKNNSLLLGILKAPFVYDPNKLVLVYDTSKEPANNTVSFPVNGSSPNVTVDWGDNTSDVYTTTGWKTHTYANPGIYVVQASGRMTSLSFDTVDSSTNNKLKLVRCLSFGNITLTFLQNSFRNCINFIEAPTSLPNTVVNLNSTFYNCPIFNGDISNWNTSNVITMSNMFQQASIFNQNIGNWNTSKVTTIGGMFNSASLFNQPIGNWDTSSVTQMAGMFNNATNFNQSIGNWNTSNVTLMGNMFSSAKNFNQSLSNWDVSAVTSMERMFYDADAFSSNLGSWNLSSLNSSARLNGFMLLATGMNTSDYDNTLIGWNNNKALFRNDLGPNFGGSKYSSAGAAARAALIAYGWTITDGGLAP